MSVILCLDIGGTNTRAHLVRWDTDEEDFIVPPASWPTPASLASLHESVEQYLQRCQCKREMISGIAAAVAGPVRNHRFVRIAPNVALFRHQEDVDFSGGLHKTFGAPAVVMNDMEAALAGEVVAGVLDGCQWGLMDTISTGWGGAVLYNGVEVAAEPGHIWVGSGLGKCGCGRWGCTEGRYSGGAVRRRVLQEVELKADARGDYSYRVPDDMDPCAFADAEYCEHESWARLLYLDVAHAIGEIWGSRLNLCPLIQKIVYQGTFAEHFFALPGILDLVRERMIERSLFRDEHEKIPIVRAEAPHGSLLGAARIFLREQVKKS